MTERLNYMEHTEDRCKEEMHSANQKAGQVIVLYIYRLCSPESKFLSTKNTKEN